MLRLDPAEAVERMRRRARVAEKAVDCGYVREVAGRYDAAVRRWTQECDDDAPPRAVYTVDAAQPPAAVLAAVTRILEAIHGKKAVKVSESSITRRGEHRAVASEQESETI